MNSAVLSESPRHPTEHERDNSEQRVTERALRAQRRANRRENASTPESSQNSSKRSNSKRIVSSPSVASRPAKVARLQEQNRNLLPVVEKSHYKLRSTSARIAAAERLDSSSSSVVEAASKARHLESAVSATVTPAAPRRQINFSRESGAESPDVSVNGIVCIFPTNDKARCHCPIEPQRSNLGSRNAWRVFEAQYGQEQLTALREKEDREFSFRGNSNSVSQKLLALKESPDTSLASSPQTTSGEDGEIVTSLLTKIQGAAVFLESNEISFEAQPFLTHRMRAVLVSWLVEVGVEFNISDAAFHLSVSILDEILRIKPTHHQSLAFILNQQDMKNDDESDCSSVCQELAATTNNYFRIRKEDLQAVGCTCAWLASKLEDHKPPSQDEFSFISDHSVSTVLLRRLEFRVCRVLSYNLHRLTPLNYVNAFLRASHACPCRTCEYENPVLREMVHYLICLARLSAELMDRRPSLVAAAALYLARATLNIRKGNQQPQLTPQQLSLSSSSSYGDYPFWFWSPTLEHYTGYSPKELRRAVLLIYRYQLQAQHLGVAAYDKFKDSSRFRVALKTARPIQDLDLPGINLTHEDWILSETVW
ncbi:hypothetical protein ACA910_010840 [Epithemia clementina (nom. ined.)]